MAYPRSGIVVDFDVLKFTTLSLVFKRQDNSFVPAGSTVKIAGKDYMVGYDGLVFMNTGVNPPFDGTITINNDKFDFNSDSKEITIG